MAHEICNPVSKYVVKGIRQNKTQKATERASKSAARIQHIVKIVNGVSHVNLQESTGDEMIMVKRFRKIKAFERKPRRKHMPTLKKLKSHSTSGLDMKIFLRGLKSKRSKLQWGANNLCKKKKRESDKKSCIPVLKFFDNQETLTKILFIYLFDH